MLVLTWEGIVLIASAIITMLTAVIMIFKLKKDILKSVDNFISKSVSVQLAPFISSHANVLRYSITRAHAQYTQEEMIDKYTLQALEYLYRDYHDMSQNGFIDELMREMRALPSRPPPVLSE